MMPQQYCLRWKYHHSNLQTMFSQLLDRGCFCDVTLACEGRTLRAHRVVLCACSTFFDAILTNFSEKDPIIIMKDCKFADIKCLIEFMYKGEINVEHRHLASLLKTAEELRIKGLAEVSWRDDECVTDFDTDPQSDHGHSHHLQQMLNLQQHQQHHQQHQQQQQHHQQRHISTLMHSAGSQRESSMLNRRSPTPGETAGEESSLMPPLPHLTPLNGGPPVPFKKKRGRPPLDEEYDSYSGPMRPSNGTASAETARLVNVQMMMDDANASKDHPHAQMSTSEANNMLPSTLSSAPTASSSSSQPSPPPPPPQQSAPPHTSNTSTPMLSLRPSSALIYDRENDRDSHHDIDMEQQHRNISQNEMDEDIVISAEMVPKLERPDTPDYGSPEDEHSGTGGSGVGHIMLTAQEQEEYKEVIRMNDYLVKGRRPQFWEEPFTKRIMEAIKSKDLEMKKAAQLLGVSYGTLYGRYRETYGCLKHPYRDDIRSRGGLFTAPRASAFHHQSSHHSNTTTNNNYHSHMHGSTAPQSLPPPPPPPSSQSAAATPSQQHHRELWSDQKSADIIGMLQQGVISLPRAAQLMNTTVTPSKVHASRMSPSPPRPPSSSNHSSNAQRLKSPSSSSSSSSCTADITVRRIMEDKINDLEHSLKLQRDQKRAGSVPPQGNTTLILKKRC